MMQLCNTLYITEPNISLRLEGKAIRAQSENGDSFHIPMHLLEKIVSFSYHSASNALLSACAREGIRVVSLSPSGKFQFSVEGDSSCNTAIRRKQYLLSESEKMDIARTMIRGKIENGVSLLLRHSRNHPQHSDMLRSAASAMRLDADRLSDAITADALRGVEGTAARKYFDVFDQMILSEDQELHFRGRNRRPPRDPCNALLSFAYSLLAEDCKSALYCVGLDPFAGVLHGERPGKPALALDLMEEFRPAIAERFVLRVINLKMITPAMFQESDDDGIILNAKGRKTFLAEWNTMRRREVFLPEYETSAPLGLLPFLQAQQFSKLLRGEIESYSELRWR